MAKDLPGVGQMLDCFEGPEVGKLRRLDAGGELKVAGRVQVCIVLKEYGLSINHFIDVEQLVCAMRDAIAGKFLFFLFRYLCSCLAPVVCRA